MSSAESPVLSPNEAFLRAYGGQPNFITPMVLHRMSAGVGFVEVSCDPQGFMELHAIGISVLGGDLRQDRERSKCEFSVADVVARLRSLSVSDEDIAVVEGRLGRFV